MMSNEDTERDDFRHGAIAAILVVILLTALAFLSIGCEKHDTSYWITPNGYEITSIDDGIDADTAMTLLDSGIEEWLTTNGQQHRDQVRKVEYVIHAGASFAILTYNPLTGKVEVMNATGAFDPHETDVHVAYHTTPPMAALHHELNHMAYGSEYGH